MNEKSEVKIERDNGEKRQWGRKFLFSIEGKKLLVDKKKLKYISLFLFFILVTIIFTSDNQTEIKLKSPFLNIDIHSGKVHELSTFLMGYKNNKKKEKAVKTSYLGSEVISRPKKEIPPGSLVKAKLITGASNGPVKAELIEELQIDGELLLEEGVIFYGTGNSTENRLYVTFNKIIFLDHSTQSIKAVAFDANDKIAGLRGSLIGNFGLKTAGSIGLNMIGGMSEGLEESEVKNGVPIKSNSIKNAFLNGASSTAIDQSKELMSSLKNLIPVIEVEAGKEILIEIEGE